MKQTLTILSRIGSLLLYPLFIPTYGMILFCTMFSIQQVLLPALFWWGCVLSTLLITCIIPLTAILFLWRNKSISSLYIEQARERTTPYIYTTLSFGCWCYLLFRLHMPTFLIATAIGATIAIAAVTLINHYWKISAHLTAIGGLLGGIFNYCMAMAIIPPIWLIILFLLISLLLMYARIYLHAHTPTQVVGGFLLGLTFTFVPNLIINYV